MDKGPSADVRMIGICGMGGLGKTTLARVIYDLISHEFEGSSFLANVREKSEREGGVISFQRQLVSQLLKLTDNRIWNEDDGIKILGSRLQHKKVLLVIDDVVDSKQLEYLAGKHGWYGSGSRIIITSRDEGLLKTNGVDEVHKPNGLNYNEALQLFNMKAFKTNQPLEERVQLSERFVNYAGGIPLAIEVLGSFLNVRSVDQWRSTLERLQRDPPNKIMSILQISFDRLQDSEKKIFLDIACFFKGKNRDYVTKILEGCGFFPVIGIEVLIERSLLIVDDDNTLGMHDLLQELGQLIVTRQSPEEPGKRSRLWKEKEVRQVLIENTGGEVMEGIIVNAYFPENEVYLSASAKAFSQMTNLRLLKISNVQLPEGLEYLSNRLQLLDWHRYPLKSLPSNLQLHKTIEFKMCYSRIEELWKGIKPLNMLKVVKLSHSQALIKTPNFTEVSNLEELDLEGCTRLREIHPCLLLHNCKNIKSLPISLTRLKCLRTLKLSGCSKFRKFPEIWGSMKDLTELFLDGTSITEVPSSIELLTGLQLLNLNNCNDLVRLPSGINGLKSLQTLNLSGCSKLENVPETLGQIESLEELDISGTAIRRPASSIFLMKNLKTLIFFWVLWTTVVYIMAFAISLQLDAKEFRPTGFEVDFSVRQLEIARKQRSGIFNVLRKLMLQSKDQLSQHINITAANISQINFSFNTPIKLDRSNYLLWRSQVLASIRGNRLEGFIDGTKPAPEEKLLLARADGSAQEIDNPEYQNWRSQDQTLLGWLLSAINEGNLSLVINCVSSFDAWRTLEKKFGVQSEARVLQLRYELNTIKKEALSIEDYCIKMKSIADKLISAGSPITEKDLMLTILNGLGSGYRDIATFITGSKMEFDDAYALLLTYETRLEQEQDDKNMFNANYAYANTCYPRASMVKLEDMKGQVLLQGSAEKGLYKLLLKPKPQSSSPTSHLSQSQINKPVSMLSVSNVSSIHQNCSAFTTTCNNSFSNDCNKKPDDLTLLHRRNGYKDYISFVDDYSRYTWIYPLKLKSDALAVFKLFKLQVENQFNSETFSPNDYQIQIWYLQAKLYTAALVNKEPNTVQEALGDKNWHQAMSDEYEALIRNKTWLLLPSSAEHKVVGKKWVFRVKQNSDGSIAKYKARLVAKGFQQIEGVDYFETFSPVVKSFTVRIMLSLAAMHKWTIRQVDVNNAFLNGELTEDVYMCQPEGFVDLQKPSYVCKLKKALYGLKQAPRAWYDKLRDSLVTKWRFRKSRADTSLLCKGKQGSIIFFLIYVDDILITGPNSAELEQFILEFSQVFALKDLGKLSYFLGIEVSYAADNIYLSQRKYIRDLLSKADMLECKGCDTPMVTGVKLQKEAKGHLGQYVEDPTGYRSLVGGLQYLVLTRPEIAYAVHKLSQYVSAPTLQHILACKRVLRYLKETEDFGLKFSTEGEMKLSGYTDADWACDIDDRKSTRAYCIYLGSNLISWSSKKQSVVARSNAESEYRALAAASAEISWIQSLFDELGIECSSLPMIWCDNVSAIELAKNLVYHSRTKHIELDMHFIRDKVLAKELEIRYIPSEEQIADILTKPLTFIHFNYFRAKLNVQTCSLSLRGDVKEAHVAIKGSA
ncbi:retrovirus-related pol polyprotein from transposon RE2 [Citrus sinensis]|nr:retrovirus-related pol polyprotein from transposon RE2 [Citrus sinensis]